MTSTALVLSSTGAHSCASVSGTSADTFLAAKNAWKKTNLEEEDEEEEEVGMEEEDEVEEDNYQLKFFSEDVEAPTRPSQPQTVLTWPSP